MQLDGATVRTAVRNGSEARMAVGSKHVGELGGKSKVALILRIPHGQFEHLARGVAFQLPGS